MAERTGVRRRLCVGWRSTWLMSVAGSRCWRALAVGLVLALTASLLTHVPASAAPKPTPAEQSQEPVPTRKVKPRAATKTA